MYRGDAGQSACQLVGPPGIAYGVDRHLPPVAVVAEGEGVRGLAAPHRDRQAERDEPRQELASIRPPALRHDPAAAAEQPQRAAAVVGRAADPRPATVNAIEREAADERQRPHAPNLAP